MKFQSGRSGLKSMLHDLNAWRIGCFLTNQQAKTTGNTASLPAAKKATGWHIG